MNTIIVPILCMGLIVGVQAQSLRFGALFHGGYDFHSTQFQALPGTFSCSPGFGSTLGKGFGFGALLELPSLPISQPLSSKPAAPSIRIIYRNMSANFTAREQQPIVLDTTITRATIEHRAAVHMPGMMFQCGFSAPVQELPLYIEPSLWLAVPLVGSFEQGEYLVEPANRGRFPDTGLRSRNITSGQFTAAASVQFGTAITVGWELPTSTTTSLRPELSVWFPLSRSVSGMDWRVVSLRGGVSFLLGVYPTAKYEQREQESEPTPTAPVETVEPTTPTLQLACEFVTRDSAGQLRPVEEVLLTTRMKHQVRPLLPYVFFDEGSADIPERYIQRRSDQATDFDETEIAALSTLEAYYHLLDIVGWRLRHNPTATLTITGCITGIGIENNRSDLALRRARQVGAYLTTVWKIESERLSIVARSLPTHPSPIGHPDGNAENARVELSSSHPAILAPLHGIEQEFQMNPPRVYAHLRSVPAHLDTWSWQLHTGTSIITTQSGGGALPSTLLPLNAPWRTLDANTLYGELQGVIASTSSRPLQGHAYRSLRIRRTIESDQPRRRVFSLILFDFDDATIPSSQEELLAMIAGQIKPTTRITIAGYTDRLGDPEHNLRLSERRAYAVARALGVLGRARIHAEGSRVLLYDNSLPEGRFYSRTIEIELNDE
ncbi:MAG: OmpA family protein [Chlorobi bacterium]|nr:OmpA family protein [Chlorobiota bacterium]